MMNKLYDSAPIQPTQPSQEYGLQREDLEAALDVIHRADWLLALPSKHPNLQDTSALLSQDGSTQNIVRVFMFGGTTIVKTYSREEGSIFDNQAARSLTVLTPSGVIKQGSDIVNINLFSPSMSPESTHEQLLAMQQDLQSTFDTLHPNPA